MEDHQSKKKYLITYLGTIGGCDVQVTTRRIMAALISHVLGRQLKNDKTVSQPEAKKKLLQCRLKTH
ncbi:hypothetical protein UPYG_G00048900 [Umbra pygmaea]|uniref:Uncharacterized protein n=1 Tax=Umbra pygmaea TaxID=75934 RepID=A0ABD0Y4V6_UMBPY